MVSLARAGADSATDSEGPVPPGPLPVSESQSSNETNNLIRLSGTSTPPASRDRVMRGTASSIRNGTDGSGIMALPSQLKMDSTLLPQSVVVPRVSESAERRN